MSAKMPSSGIHVLLRVHGLQQNGELMVSSGSIAEIPFRMVTIIYGPREMPSSRLLCAEMAATNIYCPYEDLPLSSCPCRKARIWGIWLDPSY